MSGKAPGDADLGGMGQFDFSALQGVLNVSLLETQHGHDMLEVILMLEFYAVSMLHLAKPF